MVKSGYRTSWLVELVEFDVLVIAVAHHPKTWDMKPMVLKVRDET